MTASEVQNLGTGLASLMSVVQLGAAVMLYDSLSKAIADQNTISLAHLRQAFFNHIKSCMRMPAGGATAGGSMQTGFEMELVSAMGIGLLMSGWPNHEIQNNGRRQSWELRTMEELSSHLKLELQGWGALQGKGADGDPAGQGDAWRSTPRSPPLHGLLGLEGRRDDMAVLSLPLGAMDGGGCSHSPSGHGGASRADLILYRPDRPAGDVSRPLQDVGSSSCGGAVLPRLPDVEGRDFAPTRCTV